MAALGWGVFQVQCTLICRVVVLYESIYTRIDSISIIIYMLVNYKLCSDGIVQHHVRGAIILIEITILTWLLDCKIAWIYVCLAVFVSDININVIEVHARGGYRIMHHPHLYFSAVVVCVLLFFVCVVSFSLNFLIAADASTNGEATTCGRILIVLSWVLVLCTMPLSLFVCFKVWTLFVCVLGQRFVVWLVDRFVGI